MRRKKKGQKRCIVIVNKLSGHSKHIDEKQLLSAFGNGYDVQFFYLDKKQRLTDFYAFDRIVVCGGDGTLNGVLNSKIREDVEIIYLPYGTLNEFFAGGIKNNHYVKDIGMAGDKYFSYVMAAGIFTPIGYCVNDKKKRKYKAFAYLAQVVKEYKVHRIKAKFLYDDYSCDGEYSLIMIIDSPRCFGFRFNRLFRMDDGIMHLLTIRAPKSNGLFGKIKLFFPLFRAFFIGFSKPYRSKNMVFQPFNHLNLTLETPVDFDMDGEKEVMRGSFDVQVTNFSRPITILSKADVANLCEKNPADIHQYINE